MSFRAKLLAIVAIAATALVALTVASALISREVATRLATIEDVYVPRVELGPRLDAELMRLARHFQDAVAANDRDMLASASDVRDGLLREIDAAGTAIDGALAARVRAEIQDYFAIASDLSRRLIEGEMGEPIVEEIAKMQARQRTASATLKSATRVDRDALAAAFGEAAGAEATASQVRLAISVVFLVLALGFSLFLARGVLRSFAALSAGFERFARGHFEERIPIRSRDELGAVARQANAMAASLADAAAERDDREWLKGGVAGLATELRGELEPEAAARRALRFIAQYLGVPAGTLYYGDGAPVLGLLASYGLSGERAAPAVRRVGEGLVGEAALGREIVIAHSVPPDYLRIRAGGDASPPETIALLPLVFANRVTGVLELLSAEEWPPLHTELLNQLRGAVTIALQVAHRRRETEALLVEMRAQAKRLAERDEELRATNQALNLQQEALRRTNFELTQQTEILARQQEELHERHAALQETREDLEAKAAELAMVSAYKSQFLANMSHELRTPLNSMLLLSNLLAENRDGNLSDKQVEYCGTIHSAGTDLLALINQVLDLARVESGKTRLSMGEVRLAEVAERARRVFEPQARKEGLALRVEVDPALPESIVSDQQRVDQVLTNLLGNAIKFTTAGEVALRIGPPSAEVSLERPGLDPAAAVALAVSDTGPGIPPEERARIFAPFEQLDPRSDRRYGGTGLGLSLAHELVTLLGGELQLTSEVGRGSTFTCFLPLTLVDEDAAAALPEPEGAAGSPATRPAARPSLLVRRPPDAAPLELLIIEDDDVFADAVTEIAAAAGLGCARVADGRSGIAMARATRPRGIVLDVRLPDLDGFEVMRQLRADPATHDIPVHFASAVDDAARGLALGAIGYLLKPASAEELRGMVATLVPSPGDRLRVLVVEDGRDATRSLGTLLGDDGATVVRAGSAEAAREAMRTARYDCLVVDLDLPELDGLALLGQLHEDHDEVPPVVISAGRAPSDEERRRLEAYAEAFVARDGASATRVLEEVRRFVRRLREGFDPRRRRQRPPAEVRLDGRRVLVVDDDMRTVYALSAALRAKGADVLVADTGVAALAVLDKEHVDIVLMDIMMPEMDGFEAMRRIRAQPRFGRLPIVALTAKAMKGDADRCIAAGASDYLPKPIDAGRLLALMVERLNGRPPGGDG